MTGHHPRLPMMLLAACWLMEACSVASVASAEPAPVVSSTVAPAQADDPASVNQRIITALRERRYADAISSTRSAPASRVEVDFAVGELVLQGLSDPRAVQRPAESARDALALMETSALAGHRQAAEALAATFTTGVLGGADKSVLVAPDARLAACWEAAKDKPASSAGCKAMRSGS